ncbi:glycosyltransferase family 2 protein [Clostridium sp. CCUG 7971]|uniref:glycosyltransferase family 2 protein n=1 Tax=Clostridium sp. CCUG 7971 TaxID=2811414 RepID=UPI001ABB2F85|nr:glycosyltransferase family 2 protein [Clostridium sp. CCUG 7971]MBO3443028.1 glycosyltransferase family 2 protein [Clostridium sp. CCUG 7971]
MLISLIMPTLNRYDDIYLLMDSLEHQTYKNFELIVVDQNDNNKVKEIVDKYVDKLDIKYIKSDKIGLSYNRNIGIDMAKGQVIGFPDDDCVYEYDTLEKVINFFNENKEYKIYSCKTMDSNKVDAFKKMYDGTCDISSLNVLDTITSITFFINFDGSKYTRFDEKLGVGGEFGSGEEIDYILDLINKGFRGRYFGDDIIYHPAKKHSKSKEKYQRDFNYGRGFGALCKKQIVYRKDYKFLKVMTSKLVRNVGGFVLSSNRDYHSATIKGRLNGFRQYKK